MCCYEYRGGHSQSVCAFFVLASQDLPNVSFELKWILGNFKRMIILQWPRAYFVPPVSFFTGLDLSYSTDSFFCSCFHGYWFYSLCERQNLELQALYFLDLFMNLTQIFKGTFRSNALNLMPWLFFQIWGSVWGWGGCSGCWKLTSRMPQPYTSNN